MEIRSSLDDFEEEEVNHVNNLYALKRSSVKRNSSSSTSNNSANQYAPNSVSRQFVHRQSVRSISEAPNVIGAQAAELNDDFCNHFLTTLTWLFVILTLPFSLFFIFRIIQEYERGLIQISTFLFQ